MPAYEFFEQIQDPFCTAYRYTTTSTAQAVKGIVGLLSSGIKTTLDMGLTVASKLLNFGVTIFKAVWNPFEFVARQTANRMYGSIPTWMGDIAYAGAVLMIVTVANVAGLGAMVSLVLNALLALCFAGESLLRRTITSVAAAWQVYNFGKYMGLTSLHTNNITVNVRPEGDEDPWNPVSLMFMSASKITACILSLVLVYRLPSTQSFDSLLRRFDLVPKAVKGITSMTEAVESGMKFAFGEHYKHVFGDGTIVATSIPLEIEEHAKEVLELCVSDTYSRLAGDPALCQRISMLYNKFQQFKVTHARNRTISSYLDKYAGAMVSLFAKASSHSPKNNENRPKPTLLMLSGGTGVGKSQLLYFICASIMAMEGKISNTATDAEINDIIASCMYSRAAEQDFWDAYNSQYVALWDDFGQMVDSTSNPNLEFFELIRATNTFPYPLHMADLSQKANTWFKSEYIVCTTNLKRLAPVSIVDPEAVLSRLHFSYRVSVKPEYRVDPNSSDELGMRLDPVKVAAKYGGTMSLDVYEFTQYDMKTGNGGGNPISFQTLVKAVVEHHRQQKDIFSASRQSLALHVRAVLDAGRARPEGWWTYAPQHPDMEYRKSAVGEIHTSIADLMGHIRQTQSKLEQWKFWFGLIAAVVAVVGTIAACWHMWRSSRDVNADPESGMGKQQHLHAVKIESGKSREPKTSAPKVESGKSKSSYLSVVRVENMQFESGKGKQTVAKCIRFEGFQDLPKVSAEGFFDGWAPAEQRREIEEELTETINAIYDLGEERDYPDCRVSYIAAPNNVVLAIIKFKPEPEGYAALQALEVVRKCRRKAFRFIRDPNTNNILCPIVCFGGSKFGINWHYWNRFVALRMPIKITWPGQLNGVVVSYERVEWKRFARMEGEETDLVILTIPNLPKGYALWRNFHHLSDANAVMHSTVVLTGHRVMEETTVFEKTGTVKAMNTKPFDLAGTRIKCLSYATDVHSEPGDCGGIYVADNNALVGKIIGFHYAGLDPGSLACPLFYEDFEEIMKDEIELVEPEGLIDSDDAICLDGAWPAGVVSPELRPKSSTRTQLVKTPIYGLVDESTVKPARLGPILQPGGVGLKGLAKVTGDVPMINQEHLDKAVQSFQTRVLTGGALPEEKRVLTFEEAVQGITSDSNFLKGINRSRSAGWPWCVSTTRKGKTEWFGTDAWIVDSKEALAVKARVEHLQQQMLQNKWEPAVFIDTEKDETRPIEKVDEGKTRIFAAAPMDFVILFRMYFLGFLSYVMRKRINNELAVGICAQSLDWDRLATHLHRMGDNIIAGDFSNYDGTLHPDILKSLLTIVNEYYQDGHERERAIIFESVCHSYHIADKYMYGWTHSQPSGNPGTAVINSMYNSIVCRLVYYALEEENDSKANPIHDTFNMNVSMCSYGDDNLLSVSSRVSDWFTMEAMASRMPEYGMIYTSEQKDGRVYKHKRLEECTFLQRGFRRDSSVSAWVGPLGRRSINERLNWAQKTPQPHDALLQNVDGAIAEWSLHDKETFEHWSRKIANVSLNHLNYRPPIYPHQRYLERMIYGDFVSVFSMLEYT